MSTRRRSRPAPPEIAPRQARKKVTVNAVHGILKPFTDRPPIDVAPRPPERPGRKRPPCPNCGRPISGGREDKRFCDDHCRLEFHRGGKLNRAKLHTQIDRRVDERLRALLPRMVREALLKMKGGEA